VTVAGPPPSLLSMQGIEKRYPGVRALRGVDFSLDQGEVVALLGENGAGKSTLMKLLGGAIRPDAGVISLDGRVRTFTNPAEAAAAGIAVIHQEFTLVPGLTPVDNIFLGGPGGYGSGAGVGVIGRTTERRRAAAVIDRLGGGVDLDTPCGRLPTAQQQLVEIARGLCGDARIMVMDEPTAALTAAETERLFAVVRDLRAAGVAVVWISHRLDEVFALADRVVVLRDGTNVGGGPVAALSRDRLIELMAGRPLADEFPPRFRRPGQPRLVVEGLCRSPALGESSLTVRAGEVLGIAGLIGSGRTELLRAIFGADRADAGSIRLDGQPVPIGQPRQAIAAGLGLLPEDRKRQGLLLARSVRENIGLASLNRFARAGLLDPASERTAVTKQIGRLGIRAASPEVAAGSLSGGNQQKVVLAKWLLRDCRVLLLDEPTRGIDVAARYEIYRLMNELVARGMAIVMVSSDLPELLGMADRILVMHAGRIVAERPNTPELSQQQLLQDAFGSR